MQKDIIEREKHVNMTISVDGWSSARMQSLFGAVLQLPTGAVQLLKLLDLSAVSHTADNICGKHLPKF